MDICNLLVYSNWIYAPLLMDIYIYNGLKICTLFRGYTLIYYIRRKFTQKVTPNPHFNLFLQPQALNVLLVLNVLKVFKVFKVLNVLKSPYLLSFVIKKAAVPKLELPLFNNFLIALILQ